MTKIELTNKEVKEELLDMKRDVVADSWRDKALDVAIKAVERVHTMSEEEFEAYLKDEDLVVVKRKILKKAIKVLEQTEWIPVSEKLPEPLTAVLLTVRYKSTGFWTYQMGYWEDTLEKWEKWIEIGTLDDEFEILAWMELPEIYEEDRHE